MRLLDRLFGGLDYPLDLLIPSAIWLAISIALFIVIYRWAGARGISGRRGAIDLALVIALANALVWLAGVVLRIYQDAGVTAWQAQVEAPFSALRIWLGAALWQVVGVDPAVEPAHLFRGYSSWNGHWTVLAARTLNEAAALALAVFTTAIAVGSWRSARRGAARTAG